MSNANDKALDYLEERWIDVVLPVALNAASQMAIKGLPEEEIISAANSIAKAAIKVGSTLLSATD